MWKVEPNCLAKNGVGFQCVVVRTSLDRQTEEPSSRVPFVGALVRSGCFLGPREFIIITLKKYFCLEKFLIWL